VIHAHDLTWIAWLKLPTEAPDLPRLQIIADSFAALNPSDELWRKYSSEIERLRERDEVTSEEFYILRHSMEARRALLSQTFGDPGVFTEGSIPAILAAARNQITAQLRQELDDERTNSARQAKQDQELIASEQRAREQEAAQRAEVERHTAERNKQREDRIQKHADSFASKIAYAGFVFVASIFAFATFVASKILLPDSVTSVVPVLLYLAILTVTLFSILNGVFGTNLVELRDRSERWISERIAAWLRNMSTE
jgi:ABC-type multidrug transport system fused ATPase/permease subunit